MKSGKKKKRRDAYRVNKAATNEILQTSKIYDTREHCHQIKPG